MNKSLITFVSSLFLINSGYATTVCLSQPLNGPDEILTCLAKSANTTPENYWNTRLFNARLIDGFCKKNLPVTATTAQQQIYQKSCTKAVGSYFSYANFIAADKEIATKLGSKYTFMRSGSTEIRLREFANFLATLAQETTAGETYTNDGLYWRYEDGALGSNNCYSYQANPTLSPGALATNCSSKGLDSFYTIYYPKSQYVMAINQIDTTQIYTGYVFDLDAEYVLNTSPNLVAFPDGVPNVLSPIYPNLKPLNVPPVIGWASWKGNVQPLSGYQWGFMNIQLKPGFWIGMGNLQLTGDSMTKFFGWYYQNLIDQPVDKANFQNFVERYLVDGVLAWEGGLWYWNFRVNGYQKPTLHSVLTNSLPTKAACHDIGITTWLVNGGCNHASQRVQYYQYFAGRTFGLNINGTTDGNLNSMFCSSSLGTLCTAP